MKKFQLTRFRKDQKMSQKDLAKALCITQGFLSSIENGRSPLPQGKLDMLVELFDVKNINDYMVDDGELTDVAENESAPIPTTQQLSQSQVMNSVLKWNSDEVMKKLITVVEDTIKDAVVKKQDDKRSEYAEATKRADHLASELDKARAENFKLSKRELAYQKLLMKHGIDFSEIEKEN